MSIQAQRSDDASSSARPNPTSVYRYYDAADMLIYVGITRQGIGRNLQHNRRAEWWPFVARQEVEHHPDRAAASSREKELIDQFRPPFNKQHNPDHEAARAAYLAFVASPNRESPPGQFRRLKGRLPLEVLSFEAGQLVMRSLLEHAPLAAAIRMQKEIVPVRGYRKYGRLVTVRIQGPVVLFTCSIGGTAPSHVDGGRALLGWSQNTKPQFPWVRQINIFGVGV